MGTHRDRFPRATRRRILAASVLFLLLTAAPAVATAATSAPDPCATAGLLASQGHLTKAEEELKTLPKGTTCASVTSVMADRRAQVALYVARAQESLKVGDFASAATFAAQALALDDSSAEAKNAQADATAGTANEIAQKKAIADRDRSELQRLGDEWTTFYDAQVSPLGSLLLPFLVVLLVLLVVTRLLVLWVPRWPEITSGQDQDGSGKARAPVAAIGMASLVGGSFLLTVAAAHTQQGQLSAPGRPALITAWVIGMILFVVAIIWAHQQTDLNKPSVPLWLAVIGAALGIVALAPMLLRTSASDNDAMGWVDVWAVLLLGALLSALGVWLTAWWLATRLRLDITYTDSSGATQGTMAALVAAYLTELGAERPKGLEVPVGTDVTALAGALATLPDNPVLKALKSFLTGLAGVTPWTAAIDAGERTVAVSVRRNARSVGSAVLDPESLELAEKDSATSGSASTGAGTPDDTSSATGDDVLRMAAAFVLASMAPHHRAISRGLAGATEWKSLGYHYIATAPRARASGERAQVLLARALNEDPQNRLARLAFRWTVDRDATDSRTLTSYAAFLDAAHQDLVEQTAHFDVESLILRVRYVRALVLINAAYAVHSETRALPDDTPQQVRTAREADLDALQAKARKAMEALEAHLDPSVTAAGPDDLAHFKAQFRDDIQGTKLLLGIGSGPTRAETPIGMYNLGATYASRNDLQWPGVVRPQGSAADATATDDEVAVELLRRACTDPRNKAWVTSDPQLERFRDRTAYRNAFLAKPRDDFFELGPVKPIAERLRAAGYGTASRLASESAGQLETRTYVSAATCRQIIELARLRVSLGAYSDASDPSGGRPLDEWAVEVLDQLLTRGLASHEALVQLGEGERASTMTAVVKALLETCRLGETRDPTAYAVSMQRWLTAWSSQP